MENEKKLILLLCLTAKTYEEEQEISQLLNEPLDWGYIAGQLYHHRLTGYFLKSLTYEQQKNMHPELIRNMKLLVRAQKQSTLYLLHEIKLITDCFKAKNIKYAGLKGLIFQFDLYNPGDRRSNDGDFLIMEEDLGEIDSALRSLGYIQSYFPNGEFKEASRVEKMIQRMNYHDLVPYIKKSELDLFEKIEIDINFHFDSKINDITKKIFDYGTKVYNSGSSSITGLLWETHMAHLCCHFYREATDTIWTETKRDVTLYKIVDIMNTLRTITDQSRLEQWPELMKELKLEKPCYFTLYQLRQFYMDPCIDRLLHLLKPEEDSFLYDIHVTGSEEVIIQRTASFYDSAFNLSYPLIVKS